jgi:hypothetical protein
MRLLDLALRPLADIVEFGDRTQVLFAVLLGARLRVGQQRLEVLDGQRLGGRRR